MSRRADVEVASDCSEQRYLIAVSAWTSVLEGGRRATTMRYRVRYHRSIK